LDGVTLKEDVPARPAGLRGLHYRLYDWVIRWAAHRHARWALFLIAFIESSFFPIPPDVLLIAMALARPGAARAFAALTTAGSVLGGLFGYCIGLGLWRLIEAPVFRHLGPIGFTPENFELIQTKYQENAFLAVFSSGLTPIPYKVFTIAAGVFEVSVPVFIFASILGRGARFFLIAELLKRLGPRVMPFIERYLGWLTLAFVVLLILGFVAIKLFS
jgi:membrane protein YqaA with SNARE-associated domain